MTAMFTLCGLGIITLISVSIIRQIHPEYVKWIMLTFGIICYIALLPGIEEAVLFLRRISSSTEGKYTSLIVKGLGITYLTAVASEICNSVDSSVIGRYVEMAGRVELIVLSLPLFEELLKMVLL